MRDFCFFLSWFESWENMLIGSMFAKIFFHFITPSGNWLLLYPYWFETSQNEMYMSSILAKKYNLFKNTVCSISGHQDLKQTKGKDPPKFSLPNMYMDIFCILLSLSTSGGGKRERNAWMEMTIIHQFLLPPLPSSSPANAFAKDILFTQCDLFSTDTP